MENRQIAKQFDLLAKLMELHGENPFKIRSYSSAYQNLRRLDVDLNQMTEEELMAIKGIGKAVAAKIREYIDFGTIQALEKIKSETPEGVVEMLYLKGIGPKKVRLLWKDLDITSLGELEYACFENRLLTLKGFGKKTQEGILEQLEFLKQQAGKVLLPVAETIAERVMSELHDHFPGARFSLTGAIRRKMEVLEVIELVGTADSALVFDVLKKQEVIEKSDGELKVGGVDLSYHQATEVDFGTRLFETTGPESFTQNLKTDDFADEQLVFNALGTSFIPPEVRDLVAENIEIQLDTLVTHDTQKGVIHAHSTWSDGQNSIQEMVNACKKAGYSYLVLTDHSRSAFYANGLDEDRIFQQWKEIDRINDENPGFRVFKGIESDILYHGDLDYAPELLGNFEVVITSVHSNLKMDEATAQNRLVKAIENPFTHILGHMTGRLLLSRPGYPVNHQRIIDACAENQVAIEINANPHRLDIDWRWVPYALEKGVQICISPDAHNTSGIEDMKYGVWMARKGGVPNQSCLNTLSTEAFAQWASKKR